MTSPRTPRLAVLASGRGTNLRALADADQAGALGGSIVRVLSDRPDSGAVAFARERGLPVDIADAMAYRTWLGPDVEARWVERLRADGVETILLAGFMRILHATFLDAFEGRVLNIHPSLLPAFPGVEAIARAFDHGVRVTGCTVHLVNAGVDEGPILMQSAVAVHEDDTLETLEARVHAAEHALYPIAAHAFLTHPHEVVGRRVRWREAGAP